MIALIMAGGSGTRFWPLSRKSKPKQFLRIAGGKSMLQLTVERLNDAVDNENIYIVTAQSQVALVKKHLPRIPVENIIIEPFGMNTAPCIGLSLAYLRHKISTDENILVLPADHMIKNNDLFLQSLKQAEQPAKDGYLVTFGIVPDYPATGYGYIEAGEKYSDGIYNVSRFKEKPDVDTAQDFLKQGNFFWNSGMFYWKHSVIWKAFEDYLPQVTTLLEEIMFTWKHGNSAGNIIESYAKMPKIPIDIGIMEKAEKRAVIPVDYGWSDVGSWKALADISPVDENNNCINAKHFTLDSQGNYVKTDKYVSLIGVDNLVVIETDDAILITAKDRSEDVKKVVESLKTEKRDNLL